MQEAASTKFNLPKTTTYIKLPIAFTGKDKRFAGLSLACQFLLADIYTMNKAFKGPAKLTYDHFVERFGMSRETVSKGLDKLEGRGIIERLKNSRYKILLEDFNEEDHLKIDDYLHKQLWNVGGVMKRLSRSRIIALAFLERENLNKKNNYTFTSSQARIGVAIGLPKSTAGDSVRELALVGLMSLQKADEQFKEAYRRGLTRYKVEELLTVELDDDGNVIKVYPTVKRCKPKPPPDKPQTVSELVEDLGKKLGKRAEREAALTAQLQAETERQEQEFVREQVRERKVEALHNQFKQDDVYRALNQRICVHRYKVFEAAKRGDVEAVNKLEPEKAVLMNELKAYLNAHDVPPELPAGAFYILK